MYCLSRQFRHLRSASIWKYDHATLSDESAQVVRQRLGCFKIGPGEERPIHLCSVIIGVCSCPKERKDQRACMLRGIPDQAVAKFSTLRRANPMPHADVSYAHELHYWLSSGESSFQNSNESPLDFHVIIGR
jgi:hypothetical protein